MFYCRFAVLPQAHRAYLACKYKKRYCLFKQLIFPSNFFKRSIYCHFGSCFKRKQNLNHSTWKIKNAYWFMPQVNKQIEGLLVYNSSKYIFWSTRLYFNFSFLRVRMHGFKWKCFFWIIAKVYCRVVIYFSSFICMNIVLITLANKNHIHPK